MNLRQLARRGVSRTKSVQQQTTELQRARRRRLLLEGLEQRNLLASLTWVGDADIFWNTNNAGNTNWSGDVLPTTGDTLVFAGATPTTLVNNTTAANAYVLQFNAGGYTLTGNSISLNVAGTDILNSAGNNAINLNVIVDAATDVNVAGGTFSLAGLTSGAGAINKSGPGTLVLAGSGTFSGATVVNAGTVQLGPQANQAYTITDPTLVGNQSFGGSLGYDFTVNANKAITIRELGFFDSAADGLINAHTVSISTNTGTLLASVVVPAGVGAPLKGGFRFATLATPLNLAPGTYTVWGDNYGVDLNYNSGGGVAPGPTFGGPTGEITLIQPNRNGAASTYPTSIDGGPIFRYGAASMIFSTVANPIPATTGLNLTAAGTTFDLNSISATVAALTGIAGTNVTLGSGTLTAGNAANTTFAGTISGTGGFAKQGTGTLSLTGNNSYAGVTTILNGILSAATATALGTAAGGTIVSAGSSLALTGGITIPGENVSASGNGFGGLGAIRNLAGNNVLGGTIAMQGTSASATPSAVTLQNATSSFSQAGFTPAALIDGNLTLNGPGWANDPNPTGSTAVFETTADWNPTGAPTELSFSILSGGYGNHVVGKFKLYVTTDNRANFANGAINGGQIGTNWIELTPKAVLSSSLQTMTINADNTITASGTVPNSDTYTVKANTSLANITGVRIDTFEDPSFPANGPGRPPNGNYVMVEFGISTAPLSSADTTIGSDAGTLTLNGNVTNAVPGGNLGLLGAGDIAFGATSGIVQTSGATNVFKTGTGTATNAGANNNFSGTLTVSSGTYVVGNSSALGTVAGGTVVNNGATLTLTGGVTIGAETIDAAGAGVNGVGAIRNLAGNNTLGGPINLRGTSAAVAPVNATLQNATASFSQTGFSVANMIDGNVALNTSGWANDSNPNGGSTAVFETAADLNPTGAQTELTFSILSGSFGTHTVGKFKLYITTDNRANFANGVINGGQIGSNWVPFTPTSVTSTGGVTMTTNPDGSIIASGANPDSATYTIKGTTSLANITGVRIDTLEDPSFPVNGPGRPFNGNYVLIEWSVASTQFDTADATINSDAGQLTLNGNVSAALSGTLSLLGAGAINLGATSGIVQTAGTTVINKTGTGTVTNAGANNTFAGKLTVGSGVYVAAHSSALGTAVGSTQVNNGGTLALSGGVTIAGEAISLFGTGAAGMLGSLSNQSGNNTITATSSLVAADTTQQIGIGNLAGTLTVGAPINLKYARLITDGPGNIALNGAITATLPPVTPSLANLNSFGTGDYSVTAAGQTFNARVDNDGTSSWLLIGRGRQGWEFDTDGQGTVASVNQNLGTAAAFTPAAYSNAIVNDILAQSGLALGSVEVRIKRAQNTTGTAYQENRWRDWLTPTWSWVLSNPGTDVPAGGFTVTRQIVSGLASPVTNAGANTLDFLAGNGADRIFTWAWSGHGAQRGFSFGQTIDATTNNDPANFLWESAGGENHAIPYTEVYVRTLNATLVQDNSLIKNGTGTLTLGGANTYAGTTSVNAGIVVAANNTALGSAAAGTTVASGATLSLTGGITVAGETITLNGVGAAGTFGALSNLSGNNTITATATLVVPDLAQQVNIGSVAGTLTVAAPLNLKFARLVTDGPGDIVLNGAITSTLPAPNLAGLNAYPTGDYTITAAGQTFSARVDNDGTNSWILIGRGRQGWEFDTDGQGTIAAVNSNLGTSAAFTPAAYSNAIVNDILAQSGLAMSNIEVRIKRAQNTTGTAYQENRWRDWLTPTWSWVLSNPGTDVPSGGFSVTRQIVSGLAAPVTNAGANTQDFLASNGPDRIFTWGWSGHGSQRGFSFGQTVDAITNNDPANFLWEFAGENHAIPYTEVYLRTLSAPLVRDNSVVKNGSGSLTLGGTNTYTGTTTVNAGMLNVQNGAGILDTAGAVSVAQGATFQLLSSETVSSFIAAGDIGPGTNDSTLALGNNVLTSTSGASIANVTTGASGGIVVATTFIDADDDNNVTGTGIFFQAATGVGTLADSLEMTVSNFEARTATGGVFVTNTGALAIGNVTNALDGVDVTGASGNISVVATGSISIVVPNDDISGPGNITLNAQGVTSDITTSGANAISTIRTSGVAALLSLTAGRDVIIGLPNPAGYGDSLSAGAILISAGRDFLLQQDSFLDVNGPGTNTINAGRDIILANDNSNSRLTTQGGVISLTATRHVVANVRGFILNTIDSTQGGFTPAGANVNITATTGNISIGDGVSAGTAGNVTLNAPLGSIIDTNLDNLSRIVGVGLTATSATGVLLETAVTTVTSATVSAVGNVDLRDLDAVNLLTVTAANGGVAVTAGGALTNAAAAVISATGNGNFTAPSISLGTAAGDAVNFGTLTVSSTGTVIIQENSSLDLLGASTATGAITLQSVDALAAGQNLTLPLGSSLTSTGASVTLNVGDDATLAGNVSAATTVTVNLDNLNADAAGSTLLLTGLITAPGGAFFNGDSNPDTFTLQPQVGAAVTVNGNAPVVFPGDVLNLDLTAATNPSLTLGGVGSGAWSYDLPLLPVTYISIEQVNAIGAPYHLILDANTGAFGNTGPDDLITLRRSGPDFVIERTGSATIPDNDDIGTIFQGAIGPILSFKYIGSGDNDIVTVSDAGGMLDFVSSVPGAPDNANLSGTPEFLFVGNGGVDALIFSLTGATVAQTYAIGNGTGAAGLEGEVASTSGGVTLQTYFQDVELTQRTGIGATPGALTIIGDLAANVLTTTANGLLTRTTPTGYTPFEFSGNNFNGLVVNGGVGADTIDLAGIGSGQTNPLSTTFNGNADADTLRVESTSGNIGVVTLNGNAGNDLFQLFSAINTVDGIVGQVIVDGTDGNIGGNTDTLTIIDTGDLSGDSVMISPVNAGLSQDYAVEGITSTVGSDVVLRNIDVLNYTGTQGTDTIDGRFVNTVPLHDLSTVVLSGWVGTDQFLLFTSDQLGGTGAGVTPTGTPSGLASINLFGDAPGNPNAAGDGIDTFGATPGGLVGTGSGNVGLAVLDTVRSIRPSVSTQIAIDGGQPTGLAAPLGDVLGDVLNVDVSALPNTTPVIVSTFSPGTLSAAGIQPLNWVEIEDINLVDQARLTNVQMGDLFARTTPASDFIQLTQNGTSGNPSQVRLRITASIGNYSASNKTIIYGGGLNDTITQSNLTIPAEFYGEGGDDVLSGAMNNDWLVGGLGSDRINGSGGDNVIWGDNSPTLPGDPNPQDLAIGGNDTLSGLGGNDVFYGGGGDDSVSAGGGNDYASGGQGNDTLGGSDGDDRIYGGAGNDTLGGDAGNDLLSGGSGDDNLLGSSGNDVLLAGTGADNVDGGSGDDLLVSGSVANESSSFTSLANTTTFNTATYINPADNDSALLTLLAQWAASSSRASLAAVTHDGADDDLFGSTGDDDFCWENADIADDLPALTPPDFNAPGMGSDERFAPN